MATQDESSSLLPRVKLEEISKEMNLDLKSEEFAKKMDERDPLSSFRDKFCYPLMSTLPQFRQKGIAVSDDATCIYLCGNSLGLKPKKTDVYVLDQLKKWAETGVETHFLEPLPAALCDRYGRESLGRLVGAKPECVTLMNGLSVNLNLLLLSFYQPTEQRHKILIEKDAFPSDRYAARSQAALRGFDPETSVLECAPREGEDLLRTQDILQLLEKEGPSIAVVCFSGVQYYTGQKFDVEVITKAARAQGCLVGWDLAHSIGNVRIELDKWGVDFACWCTYKYLNSGAGCIGGAYVNSRHANRDVPNLRGWWSNAESTRFEMRDHCDAAGGVDSFRICNPPPLLVACVIASLEIFDEAGLDRILDKQFLLTGYLEYLVTHFFTNTVGGKPLVSIISPKDPQQRGSQLSLEFGVDLYQIHENLKDKGVVCDVRQPKVIRVSPAPLYNSFEDVFKFISVLKDVLSEYL